jgi:hypothetical protein
MENILNANIRYGSRGGENWMKCVRGTLSIVKISFCLSSLERKWGVQMPGMNF